MKFLALQLDLSCRLDELMIPAINPMEYAPNPIAREATP